MISLFSNAYTNRTINTWRTDWSSATLTDLQVAGNDTKRYTNLDFVGVEAVGPNSINASSMLFFHVDAWTPNMTTFRIKLVDFGADNSFDGGDDKVHELVFTPTQGQWNSYEIPLTDFTGLTTKSNISQIIFSGLPVGSGTVFIDNVYFHNVTGGGPPPSEPTTAAPTPTRAAANVISLFSNAYTNRTINTWRTDWSSATLTDLQVAGNGTKRYTNLDFVGVEAVGPNSINASSMLFFHVDAWTPNMTAFRIKLVDFGADNAFQGGDDKEHELVFTPTQGQWNGYEIPLTDFTGLTTKSNISQIIFSGLHAGSGTLFIDNVYFHNVTGGGPPPAAPTTAAPAPTRPATNVISLFSNAYTNRTIDTWRTGWSEGTLTDLQITGNDVKRYSDLNFVGVESTGTNSINASSMLYFHVDIWTPNMTTFRIKLVDFGADNTFLGGDDKEHELALTPTQGQWIAYDIPLSDFTGLTTRSNISQIIFSGLPAGSGTLFIDNVYFYTTFTPQTITFPAIADKTVGDAAFQLNATASSNLPVRYSTQSSKVTLSANTVTIVNAGRVVIKANQAGNASFSAAPEVSRSFCIKPVRPTVTLTEPVPGNYVLTSSATAGNQWFLNGTAITSATNQIYSTATAGVYRVQVAVDDCLSDFSLDVPVIVKGNQTITFAAITDRTVGDSPFQLTSTTNSGLSVVYSTTSNKITITGSTVTIVSAGRASVSANQPGNASFNPAPEVTRSFCIKPAQPTITASAVINGSVVLTSSAASGNRWFLNGSPIAGATNATLTASTAGVYRVQVTVDDCVSDFSADRPLFAPQSITFPAIADRTVSSTPFQLTATASSNLPVSYSTTSEKISISGSTVTILSAGRAAVRASQAGNASFAAAADVSRSFCIRPAPATITATGANSENITLTSSASVGNRWFLNGVPIPSATNTTLIASAPGVYRVQVVIDDCVSDFSADFPLIVTGDLPGSANSIGVYPNPVGDKLQVVGVPGQISNISLMDLTGKQSNVEFEKTGENYAADVRHLTQGVYLLQVQSGNVLSLIRIIKK